MSEDNIKFVTNILVDLKFKAHLKILLLFCFSFYFSLGKG